jgi:hypothetical protein
MLAMYFSFTQFRVGEDGRKLKTPDALIIAIANERGLMQKMVRSVLIFGGHITRL